MANCSSCGGRKTIPCPICSGTSKKDCSTCGGAKKIVCPTCGGTGK